LDTATHASNLQTIRYREYCASRLCFMARGSAASGDDFIVMQRARRRDPNKVCSLAGWLSSNASDSWQAWQELLEDHIAQTVGLQDSKHINSENPVIVQSDRLPVSVYSWVTARRVQGT
jgi:hypothetical protein